MLPADPTLHDAVSALLAYILIGSLVWMFTYCRGSFRGVYATRRADASALITLLLIIGWPGVVIEVMKGSLR